MSVAHSSGAEGLRQAAERGKALNRNILRAAVFVTGAGIVVKFIATFKEFAVAGIFGRSDAMDAFLAALLIPNLLVNVFAESMSQALIPTLVRVRLQQGHKKALELLSNSNLMMLIMLGVACVTMELAARSFLPLLTWSFPPGKFDLCLQMFWVLLPFALLTGLAVQCAAALNTAEHFALPALAPALVPLSIVAGALTLHKPLGIWSLVLFTIIGTAAYAGLMAWRTNAVGYPVRFRWYGKSDATMEVARQYGPALLGSVVASGGLIVDQAMAASLPAGSVSTLAFAGRFVGVVVTLMAGAVASAVAPYFSLLVAEKDWPACRKALGHWARLTALGAIPLTAGLMIGARLLVTLTLQHGVFSSRDTSAVATVLVMYAIQIPFFAVSRVYYRFVLAMRRTDLIFYCGILNLILDIILDLVLMRSMGVKGLALATSLWTVSTCVFMWICAHRLLAKAERAQAIMGRS